MTQESRDMTGNVAIIIERFGGIRPMSAKTAIPVTTIQGWKNRDTIPANRLKEIREAAMLHHIDMGDLLTLKELTAHTNEAAPTSVAEEKPVKKHYVPHDDTMPLHTASNSRLMIGAGIVIFAAAAIGVVCAIAPEVRKLSTQEQRMQDMQAEIAKLHEQEQSPVQPAVAEQLSSLKGNLDSLAAQTKSYASQFEDLKSGSMSQRVSKLESHMEGLVDKVHVSSLQNMVAKVQNLQLTPDGETQLNSVTQSMVTAGEASGGDQQDPQKLAETFQRLRETDPNVAAAFQDIAPGDMRAAVMLMGLTQLRNSMSKDNTSFEQDLKLLKMTAAKDDPDLAESLERLAPRAKNGVLTADGLSKKLRGMTGDIVAASITGQDVTVKDRAATKLGEVITVEKNGERINGTDTQRKLAEAQRLLDAGDIAGSVAILDTLEGEAAVQSKPFIDEANATMLANQLMAKIKNAIVAPVKSVVGAGPAYTTNGGGIVGTAKTFVPQAQGFVSHAKEGAAQQLQNEVQQ